MLLLFNLKNKITFMLLKEEFNLEIGGIINDQRNTVDGKKA
jgi:hypothetical protein